AVIVTVLIAAALPALDLKPGTPLPFQRDATGALPTDQSPQTTISISTFLKALLETVLVMVLVYAAYKYRKGLRGKELLLPALITGILTLIVLDILFALVYVHINFDVSAPEILPPAVNIKVPPLGAPPAGLLWLVLGGLAAGIFLLGLWLVWWRTRPAPPVDSLESEAHKAMQALHSGAEWKDVILHCYVKMSRILQQEQKLELKQTMTAREFERLLEARGFPPGPVRQLTGLFEHARYGDRPTGPGDEQQAYDCLNAIVQYSRLSRRDNVG
ncbi:MAG TPA: DUF4129 domain-containing protein, partial [Anaerolineales bacterium]|nr:DUF4129 domain-containing protein [Anaerolineales bacterium]